MNNILSWNTPNRLDYRSYQKKQDSIFKLWDLIYDNNAINSIFSDTLVEKEDSFSIFFEQIKSKLETLYGRYDDDYITECGLAIQIIKSCNGSDDFFTTIDKFEYYSRDLKWILRDYIKKINKNEQKYESLIENLKASSLKAVNSYIEQAEVPLNTSIGEIHKYYSNSIIEWQKSPSLDTLWNDRDFQNLSWEGNKTAFYTLFILDKKAFIDVIQGFKDPYSCKMALHAIDNELSVGDWRYLVENTQPVFHKDGTWDKTKIVLPLLMYFYDFKLSMFISSFNLNIRSNQSELDYIKQTLDELVDYIVKVLWNVSYKGTFRWVLYKFKELRNNEIIEKLERFDDQLPKVQDYLNSRLILEFSTLFTCFINDESSNQLITWSEPLSYEEWFAHVFLGLHIESRASKNIDTEELIKNSSLLRISEDFFYKWYFDIENWYSKKGLKFRQESSDFAYYGNKFDFRNDKYYFLSYLLFITIKGTKTVKLWNNLLLSSDLFLDILKYQTYRDSNWDFDNHSHSRYALGILNIIGLNLVMLLAKDNNELSKSIYNSLYQLLFRAFESDTISELYFSMIKLLSFLRLDSQNRNESDFKILNNVTPSIEGFLYDLQPHDREFFEIIYFLNLNGFSESAITSAINNINVKLQVDSFNKMIEIDNRRYTFENYFIQFLKTLEKLSS
ncbi:hypothetical protein Q8P09_11975 [Psychrobacter faecalis]|uniref:Uncharacterized protein n=1 Tax=Psychrobacter faecalis TaxID=180588 RepID=A0ABT9HJI0_9GAMM|nr:hypothetical protein [Psychrobacter faecalis]MDP4545792.1 hypothetical protein [Psychrobacter faecalis]